METKEQFKLYELYKDKEKVYIGSTNDIDQRKDEHIKSKDFDTIKIVATRSTKEKAKELEIAKLKAYAINNKGKLPKYNHGF